MSEMVERAAEQMAASVGLVWGVLPDTHDAACGHSMPEGCKQYWRNLARIPIEALWSPTEEMWGGLARDLIAWDRGMPNQYGSTLYKHLRATGRPIPDWLLQEIPDIVHTPPKGSVAVAIFKAMVEEALK